MKKNYKVLYFTFLLLVVSSLLPTYAGHVDFDGGGGFDFNSNVNVPMPSNPTPVPSSGSSYDSQSSSSTTSTRTKSYTPHSSSSPLLTPQMMNDVVDSVYNQMVMQARQKALEEQRQAEEKRRQEEARKKKDAQDFLKDYVTDTTPRIDNVNAHVRPLRGGRGENSSRQTLKPSTVPEIGQNNDNNNENKNTNNTEVKVPAVQPQPVVSKPTNPDLFKPGKTEGELREMYYNADREIMQCASGKKECSPEYVKSLQMKRLTAEQGLTINYNYKEINGQFIKSPY